MSASSLQMSLFNQSVVKAMRALYPESLADKSFDNTGLLLEAPRRPGLRNAALLTIDLTKAVADEAIQKKTSIIVAYHPIIFRPLKSITLENTQQQTLMRLAQKGISVYSPHTAVDAVNGGVNDWLVDAITGNLRGAPHHPLMHSRYPIKPIKDPPVGFMGSGYGLIVRLHRPEPLRHLVARVTESLHIKLSVAVPQSVRTEQMPNIMISSVGVCAGSGGSMLAGLNVDLLFTGEMSHHEALAAIEKGQCVLTSYHSLTERGWLKYRLQPDLIRELEKTKEEWDKDDSDRGFEVELSSADRDPFDNPAPAVKVSGDGGQPDPKTGDAGNPAPKTGDGEKPGPKAGDGGESAPKAGGGGIYPRGKSV